MPFGVKKFIPFIKYLRLIIAFTMAIIIHQTQAQAQGLQRGGVKKSSVKTDTLETNNKLVGDSLITDSIDTIEQVAVKLSYKQRFQSILSTKDLNQLNYQNLDTNYRYFHQFNPANRFLFKRYTIGPLGSPAYSLLPNFEQPLNFNLGMDQFTPYQFNKDSIAVFKINAPYTYINWIFGTKAHQSFEVLHANRIKNLAQFGLRFRRMGSEGYYAQQKTGHSDFSAYVSYDTPNKRYKNIFTLLHNKYAFQQNGGIEEDSIHNIFAILKDGGENSNGDIVDYPITRVFRRDLVPVFLDDAISREKKWSFAFNQYLNFGQYVNEASNDTSYLKKDSIQQADSTFIKRFVPQFRLKHRIAFSNEYYAYEDENGGDYSLYPYQLINQTNYYVDSIQQKKWHHELAIIQTGKTVKKGQPKLLNNKANPHRPVEPKNMEEKQIKSQTFSTYLGLHMENVRLSQQYNFDTAKINHAWVQAKIEGNALEKLHYHLNFQYALFDNRVEQKTHYLKANLSYALPENLGEVGVQYLNNRFKSPYLRNTYRSNFYVWNKSFPLSNTQQIEGFYRNPDIHLYASYQQILYDNLVLLDTTTSQVSRSHVVWDIDSIQGVKNIREPSSGIQFRATGGTVHRFNLHKTFKLGWWRMRHQFHFQTTENELLFMPKIVYQGTWYYSDNWFKRALDFNVGIDVRYTSNFNLPVYHPVLGQFFAQQEDTFQFYPQIDFFINFKIKTATFFFKAAYVNQGLFQRGYYAAYNYPQADIAIQGGISWRFFD